MRAVVVHGQTAAEVEVAHGCAFLHEAGVDACGFHDGGADVADVGNLRAEVIVHKLQGIEHVVFLENVHDIHDLGGGESEGRAFAAGLRPVTAGLGAEFDAHADLRPYVHASGLVEDDVEFAGHFQHEDDVEAHAQGVQTEIDEFLVLVAVADEAGFPALELAYGRDEFGLGTDFQTVMIGGAVLGDLFHDLLLLVHLDGEHAAIVTLVAQFADGGPERLMQKRNLGIENVLDAEQYGQIISAILEFVNDLKHADFRSPVASERTDDDLTLW